MLLIGIAGGSGSGKSSISYKLVDSDPIRFEVLNLDDYQKLKTDINLPMFNGKINWDHPDIIRWDDLLKDIQYLENGKDVSINSWSHRSNPNYAQHGEMTPRTIQPKPVLIIEGYLALYNKSLNNMYERKYYLDLDETALLARRGKNEIIDDGGYEKEILIPMHRKYVEPTKKIADKIIDVSSKSIEEVEDIIRKDIAEF